MKEIKKDIFADNCISIEHGKYMLDTINDWIKAADNKISISCGMYSLILGIIVFVANRTLPTINKQHMPDGILEIICVAMVVISICGFIAAFFFYTWALKPNLIGNNKSCNKKPKWSLFYKEIARFGTPENFVDATLNVNKNEFRDELFSEVFYNSVVCNKKMCRFQIGIVFSGISVFSAIGASLMYVLII